MNREVVEIRVNSEGNFTFEAKEGFTGQSCIEKTKDLELALGGVAYDSQKKDEYYQSDDNPLNLNLD